VKNRYTSILKNDDEFEPGSRGRVLRNRLGITSVHEMQHTEAIALRDARIDHLTEILSNKTMEPVSAELIRSLHRNWLEKIYTWAGEYRTVDMCHDGFMFPQVDFIELNMERLEKEAQTDFLPWFKGSNDALVKAVAKVHGELLRIHPFREGNGRLARWLADNMLFENGIMVIPDYGFIGDGAKKQQEFYLKAVFEGYRGNYSLLADFFGAALARRIASSRKSRNARGEAPSYIEDSYTF
jgi:cell filamentation protein